MTEIAHGKSELGDLSTANASFITVATVPASNFVANGIYKLVVKAYLRNDAVNDEGGFRVRHGSTVFPRSVMDTFEVNSTNDQGGAYCYVFVTEYTVPATAEDITLQLVNNSGTNAHALKAEVFWKRLDQDLTENTDWHFQEDTGNTLHTTSFVARSTMTKTFAAGDWLISAGYHVEINGTSVSYEVRLDASGGGLAASSVPLIRREGEDSSDQMVGMIARVFTLDGTSATFKLETRDDPATAVNNWIGSCILAENLDAYEGHFSFFNEGEIAATTDPTFAEIANADPNVATTGDWFLGAHCAYDSDVDNKRQALRIQSSGATINQAGAEDDFIRIHDVTDEADNSVFAQVSLASGVRDLDVDATTNDSSGNTEDRTFYGHSMELAAAGGIIPQVVHHRQQQGFI